MACSGRLTQWFRVPSSHGGSHWFESSTAHHLKLMPGTQVKNLCRKSPPKEGFFLARAGSALQNLHYSGSFNIIFGFISCAKFVDSAAEQVMWRHLYG